MAFYSNIYVWGTAESNQKSPLPTDVISSKVKLIPLLFCIEAMLAAYCLLDVVETVSHGIQGLSQSDLYQTDHFQTDTHLSSLVGPIPSSALATIPSLSMKNPFILMSTLTCFLLPLSDLPFPQASPHTFVA